MPTPAMTQEKLDCIAYIIRLKDQGTSFADIGVSVGVKESYAKAVYYKYRREMPSSVNHWESIRDRVNIRTALMV